MEEKDEGGYRNLAERPEQDCGSPKSTHEDETKRDGKVEQENIILRKGSLRMSNAC